MSGFTCDDLYSKEGLIQLLRSFDIHLKKNLGQHFLFDRSTLGNIAEAAGRGRSVVEIGAGLGELTCLLKRSFDKIYAIEIDERFNDPFKEVNPEKNVKFVNEDFLNLDLSQLVGEQKEDARIVGNIPYQITGKVLELLISHRAHFSKSVLTMQKEVSDRILTEPGTRKCGSITYFVHAYTRVDHVMDVPPEAFFPPPKVDSSTVEITPTRKRKFDCDEDTFFSLIRGSFIHRRKTIRKSMTTSPEFSLTKHDVDSLLDRAEIDSRKRPEELSLGDYNRLARELVKIRKEE